MTHRATGAARRLKGSVRQHKDREAGQSREQLNELNASNNLHGIVSELEQSQLTLKCRQKHFGPLSPVVDPFAEIEVDPFAEGDSAGESLTAFGRDELEGVTPWDLVPCTVRNFRANSAGLAKLGKLIVTEFYWAKLVKRTGH